MKKDSAQGYQSPSRQAYTLIELLVVMSIMGIIFGVGIAKYNDFNRRQIVTQAALELKSNLRLIQNKASSGEKDPTCSSALEGWYISFGVNSYRFYGRCDGGEFSQKEVSLVTKHITISSSRALPSIIRFKSLGQGSEHGLGAQAQDSTTITLAYLGSGFSQQVFVSKTGEIR